MTMVSNLDSRHVDAELLSELLWATVARQSPFPTNSSRSPSLQLSSHVNPFPHFTLALSTFNLSRVRRAISIHDGHEPFDRVGGLNQVFAARLELTPGSQRFNLISKSDIRYVANIHISLLV